ncbi:zf-HC2 domain-containing protein [[Clostridium] hylemonae]|uniref:zf-HC2 domain-containing protein n=1 Tax=[Clostridium] hylemonae TaxID=89153 RepID=UPI001FCB54FA|nr:zf-HC2 domain-containing protein [[Clostridium] hylemonae]BDF03917.1 hypothetical protein CE91St63_09790 [[Clostridium] hylemonae]
MNDKIPCNIIHDLLPLYVDGLTTEETNGYIKEHLEKCSDCQKEYSAYKKELATLESITSNTEKKEVAYLKKINLYQKASLILGAIISFLLGACIPILKVGVPVILSGGIQEYQLARLRVAWSVGLMKMAISGLIVCAVYIIVMLMIKSVIKRKKINFNEKDAKC